MASHGCVPAKQNNISKHRYGLSQWQLLCIGIRTCLSASRTEHYCDPNQLTAVFEHYWFISVQGTWLSAGWRQISTSNCESATVAEKIVARATSCWGPPTSPFATSSVIYPYVCCSGCTTDKGKVVATCRAFDPAITREENWRWASRRTVYDAYGSTNHAIANCVRGIFSIFSISFINF